ncbi:MAG: KpsF/GutQ family sugar-phosphate isomerase [Opitutales bacterium]|nr:KpsF/GutQ family sugar-phosphate isomerase [Opitutales bacterium]
MRLLKGSITTSFEQTMDEQAMIERGRECLDLEAKALAQTRESINGQFVEILKNIDSCVRQGGKLIFSGVGKNEPICEKIKATFNSTGVSAVYLDPLKALHGDLGLCQAGDLAFLFSNSGSSEELIALNAFLKRQGVRTVAFTSEEVSPLSKTTDLSIFYFYGEEACPLSLAPTSSTTAALGLGDALAMVFLEMRGFRKEDFAKYHPSGRLGKSLLLKVGEVMRKGEKFAMLPDSCSIRDAVMEITRARCGTIALVDENSGTLKGVFSDGDLRRASLNESDVLSVPVQKYMTRDPITVTDDALAVEALKIFQTHRINDIIVLDADKKPVGVVDGQDLPSLQLI